MLRGAGRGASVADSVGTGELGTVAGRPGVVVALALTQLESASVTIRTTGRRRMNLGIVSRLYWFPGRNGNIQSAGFVRPYPENPVK